jgi:uncharacterized protein
MDDKAVIDATRRWVAEMVIELNLCPFARRVFEGDKIQYIVNDAVKKAAVLAALANALRALTNAPIEQIETTLLILPRLPGTFLDYMEIVGAGEHLIADLGLRGDIQLAGFHPTYQFAGTAPDAVENYTNRSPYPMLHVLREDSVTAIADDPDQLLEIPERNIETLRSLGRAHILAKLKAIYHE